MIMTAHVKAWREHVLCDAHVQAYGFWLWSAPECNHPGFPAQTRP